MVLTNALGRLQDPWAVPTDIREPSGQMLRTTDLDEARVAIVQNYSPGQLRLTDSRQPLDMQMWVNTLPELDLNYVSFGTDVSVTAPPTSTYVICVPTSGHVLVGSAQESVEASAEKGVVISPDSPVYFDSWSADCQAVTARLSKDALETLLASILDEPLHGSIRFDLALDLSNPSIQSLLRTLVLLRGELSQQGDVPRNRLIAQEATRLVMTGLLLGQPHNYSELLRKPARLPAPSHIRKVIGYIEANPAAVSGVTDLARVATLSVRALEDGFRRHVGIAPMAYVRTVRGRWASLSRRGSGWGHRGQPSRRMRTSLNSAQADRQEAHQDGTREPSEGGYPASDAWAGIK